MRYEYKQGVKARKDFEGAARVIFRAPRKAAVGEQAASSAVSRKPAKKRKKLGKT